MLSINPKHQDMNPITTRGCGPKHDRRLVIKQAQWLHWNSRQEDMWGRTAPITWAEAMRQSWALSRSEVERSRAELERGRKAQEARARKEAAEAIHAAQDAALGIKRPEAPNFSGLRCLTSFEREKQEAYLAALDVYRQARVARSI